MFQFPALEPQHGFRGVGAMEEAGGSRCRDLVLGSQGEDGRGQDFKGTAALGGGQGDDRGLALPITCAEYINKLIDVKWGHHSRKIKHWKAGLGS